jgi:hypothetical protein
MNSPDRLNRKEKHYALSDVLPLVRLDLTKREGKQEKVDFDGIKINMASDRYKCFVVSGTNCKECGLEGKYFRLEQLKAQPGNDAWHFNLYGLDNKGKEVLITKDHIIPTSKGGKNDVENYQTLCYLCNMIKGHKVN